MNNSFLDTIFQAINAKRSYQYWALQLGGWLGLCLVSFVSLTLWYNTFVLPHVIHTFLQAVAGMVLSLILGWVFELVWHRPLLLRAAGSILAIALIAIIWTAVRIAMFTWLTNETGLWADFGGWYFASFMVFVSWSACFYCLKYYSRLQKEHTMMLAAAEQTKTEHIKRQQAETIAREAQIKMLRYQLNPHFLCNTLNAINALVSFDEKEKAQKMTVQLSQFLRYSLDINPEIEVTLEQEVHALMLYLDIEKTRFEERLELDFSIKEQAKNAMIPSLLLQPIVENSIKYSVAPSEAGGTISLHAKVLDDQLIIEMSDTGSGAKVASSKIQSFQGRGVGLRNIKERLEVLYNTDYQFELSNSPGGGLNTIIRIPFHLSGLKQANKPTA